MTRLRKGEELLERQAARGIVFRLGESYHFMGCAALLLGQLDEARRLGDRAVESSASRPGHQSMRCTCSATSRPISRHWIPRMVRRTTARLGRCAAKSTDNLRSNRVLMLGRSRYPATSVLDTTYGVGVL